MYAPNAINYMFPYRCVVETNGYIKPPLKFRAQTEEFKNVSPPAGASQPPFAEMGNIEKVKLDIILPAGTLWWIKGSVDHLDKYSCRYIGSQNNASSLQLLSAGFLECVQSISSAALDFVTLKASVAALPDTAQKNVILSKLSAIEVSANTVISKAAEAAAEVKLVDDEIQKIDSATPETDAQVAALRARFQAVEAKALSLKTSGAAQKNYQLILYLANFLGPAEKLGQPVLVQ
jgi:hypothetical protein